jgi:hypothetical protein
MVEAMMIPKIAANANNPIMRYNIIVVYLI